MNDEIDNLRIDYKKATLSSHELNTNPIEQFKHWFNKALKLNIKDVNAMVLSTVSSEGIPSGRVLLLKGINSLGFTFFTNYNSSKAKDISFNPSVSMTFFWPELEQQIRIYGKVTKLDAKDSDAYFDSRPKESQISALASDQSSKIDDRSNLENEIIRLKKLYKNSNVPRPEYWGGYLLSPIKIEFWQGRVSRLHDRFLYELVDGKWEIFRLAP
tara:strand:+ start:154 stop:795 length:642 start_codon:yes stop_codon:yes gene_type:complete